MSDEHPANLTVQSRETVLSAHGSSLEHSHPCVKLGTRYQSDSPCHFADKFSSFWKRLKDIIGHVEAQSHKFGLEDVFAGIERHVQPSSKTMRSYKRAAAHGKSLGPSHICTNMNFVKCVLTAVVLFVGLSMAAPTVARRAPTIEIGADSPVPGENS
ncbi:hypothetical protein EIP86_000319 [Pleurotus ostreatoroseus]|nr:hypothetical protein EIP86_000319 [Pleurotus ostreatoroseus]